MSKFLIEVCANSVQSAINAQTAGAGRVELCACMSEGGCTPSKASIKLAREKLHILLHVLIRPRGGDFCYSDIEFEIMKQDIAEAKKLGTDGIVCGILNPDGSVDMKRMDQLILLARPMQLTFHRAFDMCRDPYEALETLIDLGVERILSSGQKQSACEGRKLIAALIEKAKERIILMPGSGINASNIAELAKVTGAHEFHLSGKTFVPGKMTYRNPAIKMGGHDDIPEYDITETDVLKIAEVIKILKNIYRND